MQKRLLPSILFMICSLPVLLNTACKKIQYTTTTTTDVNIVGYLRNDPARFSEFVKILERTNIAPFLNAYGSYTCFAPTNDAIALYVQKKGKKSADDLDTATLKAMCRLHLIQDTISTLAFTDGKLSTPTMYGQYLITSVNEGGIRIVNRQAAITQSNILTGNGYIHVLDHVLEAATLTVAQTVEQNSKYSIFTQALKATGLYDSLNIVNNPDTTRRWLTLLAESDSVLNVKGYASYADLKAKYNNTGDPKNTKDSLYLYMAYHIVPAIDYLADIISTPSLTTLAPLEVVTTSLNGTTILLNDAIFNGVAEPGIPMDRPNSDVSCTNGVLHSLLGDIFLKVRSPVRVDMDLADQPELRAMTSIFRKTGKSVTLTLGQLSNVTWQQGTISYSVEPSTSTNYYYWNDLFTVTLRIANSSTNAWIEFTTPLLVKGKYKVWICYRRSTGGGYTQASVDGNPLSRIIDFTQYLPSTTATDAVLEAQGYKRYAVTPSSNSTQAAQLAGAVDIPTTDKHKIRLTCIKDMTGTVTMDMIQFIPINDVQTRPLFQKDGTIVP